MNGRQSTPPPPTRTGTLAPSLDHLVAQLMQQAGRPGAYGRLKLATGLDVILHRVEAHRWRLALARENVFPADEEVDAWRALVRVPVAAEPQRAYRQHTHPKTKRPILYHVIELTWREYTYAEVTE